MKIGLIPSSRRRASPLQTDVGQCCLPWESWEKHIQYTFWAKFGGISVKVGGPYIQLPLCFEELKDNGEKTDRFYFTKKKGNKKERGIERRGRRGVKNGRTCSVIAVNCGRNPPNWAVQFTSKLFNFKRLNNSHFLRHHLVFSWYRYFKP